MEYNCGNWLANVISSHNYPWQGAHLAAIAISIWPMQGLNYSIHRCRLYSMLHYNPKCFHVLRINHQIHFKSFVYSSVKWGLNHPIGQLAFRFSVNKYHPSFTDHWYRSTEETFPKFLKWEQQYLVFLVEAVKETDFKDFCLLAKTVLGS